MKRTFVLPIKALSINDVHCRDQRYLTAKAQEWIKNFLHIISEDSIKEKLKDIRDHFNSKKHSFKIDLTFYYPRDKYYTDKNEISSRIHDLTNIEKPLVDVLFLPKHHGDNPPYKALNLNVDDKFISDLTSKKRPAEDYLIEVSIEVISLEEVDIID
jgi:Holliday junction resolvase RusA-like endonuclease